MPSLSECTESLRYNKETSLTGTVSQLRMPSLCNIHYKKEIYGNLEEVSTIFPPWDRNRPVIMGHIRGVRNWPPRDRTPSHANPKVVTPYQPGRFTSILKLVFYYRPTPNSPVMSNPSRCGSAPGRRCFETMPDIPAPAQEKSKLEHSLSSMPQQQSARLQLLPPVRNGAGGEERLRAQRINSG